MQTIFKSNSPKCIDCGNPLGRKGLYARLWNHLCNQAAGAVGRWCNRCVKVVWEQPDENLWIQSQPGWVGSYQNLELKRKYSNV